MHVAFLRFVFVHLATAPVALLQGDPGDLFYVIKEGEASVYQVCFGWGAL